MIRWFIKWVFRLVILAVVLVIVLVLSFNSIVRVLIEHNISEQTGMDAEIGRVEVGWTKPTFEIRDLKIYNSLAYGGTPFLDVPEIHIEYDREALVKKELHIKLLRLNLAELDIVRSKNGRINVFTTAKTNKPGVTKAMPSFHEQTGYEFKGIDVLNVSYNKEKFIDLQNPRNNREQIVALQNCVVPRVKSAQDLAGLVFLIDLRSNHFFDPLVSGQLKGAPLLTVLNLIGAAF